MCEMEKRKLTNCDSQQVNLSTQVYHLSQRTNLVIWMSIKQLLQQQYYCNNKVNPTII